MWLTRHDACRTVSKLLDVVTRFNDLKPTSSPGVPTNGSTVLVKRGAVDTRSALRVRSESAICSASWIAPRTSSPASGCSKSKGTFPCSRVVCASPADYGPVRAEFEGRVISVEMLKELQNLWCITKYGT